jgi:hypothetical protein
VSKDVKQSLETWESRIRDWRKTWLAKLARANRHVDKAHQKGVDARARMEELEIEVDKPRKDDDDGTEQERLLAKLSESVIRVAEAKELLRLNIFKREELLDATTQRAQNLSADRAPMLKKQVARFIATEREGLEKRLQALQVLENTLDQHDGDGDLQAFIERQKTPEKAYHQTKALRLLEYSVQYQLELAAGSNSSRHAAAAASAAVMSMGMSEDSETSGSSLEGGAGNDDSLRRESQINIGRENLESEQEVDEVASDVEIEQAEALMDAQLAVLFEPGATEATSATAVDTMRPLLAKVEGKQAFLKTLNKQRCVQQELKSADGFAALCRAMGNFLDQCTPNPKSEAAPAKDLMNMSQTFFMKNTAAAAAAVAAETNTNETVADPKIDPPHLNTVVYTQFHLRGHALWRDARYWGQAMLLTVAEEVGRRPQSCPWEHMSSDERAAEVSAVHNIVFAQLNAFLFHMRELLVPEKQIYEFAAAVSRSFGLGEAKTAETLLTLNALTTVPDSSSAQNTPSPPTQSAQGGLGFSRIAFPELSVQGLRNRLAEPAAPTRVQAATKAIGSFFGGLIGLGGKPAGPSADPPSTHQGQTTFDADGIVMEWDEFDVAINKVS